jgi:dihydrofolate reductase
MMRTLFLFMNVSLDGYFEGPDNDISAFNGDFEAFSHDKSRKVDTMLFGRKTYDMMEAFWPTPQAEELAPEVASFMNEQRKVVITHTPFELGWNNVTVVSDDVIAEVRKLKEQPGESIAMFGSNSLCVDLMQAGLIDEFHIMVNPVALGAGTPLFAGLPEKANLSLVDSHRFDSGVVLLKYKPAEA